MKTCLAMAFQNEAHWLRLHLPVLMRDFPLSGFVALDGGSHDESADIVRSFGGVIYQRAFDWNFGAHMNALIEACEAEEYDALIRLDPDELMFNHDLVGVLTLLQTFSAIRLARYNFEGDRQHFYPYMYPDYQTRAFRLHHGVRYVGKVHETIEASMKAIGWREDGQATAKARREIVMAPNLHIYHYEGLRRDRGRWIKHHNYQCLLIGQQPVEELPGNMPEPELRFRIPFEGAQPLDPYECGIHAPFEVETL